MNRGVDHGEIFFGDEDRKEFGRRLAAIHDEHGVATLAYCLMPNHFHLLLRAPPDALSEAMQHLLSVYTRHTNDRVRRDGPLLRGRFHSIPVETTAYLTTVTRYIHRNPLVLPGVESPADFRWSSLRAYLGLRPTPAFLDIAPVLSLFRGRRSALAAFTTGDADPGVLQEPLTVADLELLVACAIAIDDLTSTDDNVTRQHLARTVLVLIGDRTDDVHLRGLVHAHLASPSRKAALMAAHRAHRRYASEPVVRRVVAWVEHELAFRCRPTARAS